VNAAPAPATRAAHADAGDDTLARLAEVIESRKPAAGGDPEKSYVARLFAKGTDAILKKVGEEATEVVMAAKDGQRERLVAEVADLWFHSMVALAHFGARPADVLAELARREGLSGLEEFARRSARERERGERGDEGHPAAGAPAQSPAAAQGDGTAPVRPGESRP
jgi:phosphoribosyl-ATP pyrophosphohydrolase